MKLGRFSGSKCVRTASTIASGVPYGTGYWRGMSPSDESLGYSRSSLRDWEKRHVAENVSDLSSSWAHKTATEVFDLKPTNPPCSGSSMPGLPNPARNRS